MDVGLIHHVWVVLDEQVIELIPTLLIRYDTIRQKSLTWTQKLSIQLNLAHVARN